MDVKYSADKSPIVNQIRATFGDEAPDSVIADIKDQLRSIDVNRDEGIRAMGFALASLIFAGFFYGLSRLMGWIASGFAGE